MTLKPTVSLTSLPRNRAVSVVVEGREIVFCRTDDGVCALDGICTHQDLSLDGGEVVEDVLTCPWHGARYDVRTGRVLSLPAIRSLKTYKTTVAEDGVVHIET